MISPLRSLVLSALLVLSSSNALATADTHTQAALTLLEVTNSHKLTEQMIIEVKQLLKEISVTEDLSEPQAKLFTDFQEEMESLIESRLSWNQLQKEYALIYTEAYSEEELNQLSAFYQTPLGQKLLLNAAPISESLAEIPQKHINELLPEMQIAAQNMMEEINNAKQTPSD